MTTQPEWTGPTDSADYTNEWNAYLRAMDDWHRTMMEDPTDPMPPTDARYEAALTYARTLGTEHGHAAATWYEVSDAKDAAAVLAGIEDCDPAILDTFPYPDLSGEWADGLTGPQLVSDAIRHAGMRHANGNSDPDPFGHAPGACEVCDLWDATGELCDAYEDAFRVAVEIDIERYVQSLI